jgi:hypothetical protein
MRLRPTAAIPGCRCVALALLLLANAASAQVFYTIRDASGDVDWLLGTLHSEDPRVLAFPPVLEQALLQADYIALELVPDREVLARLQAAMRLPEPERLGDRLDPALYRRTIEALAEYGVPPEAADRLRPWAAAMTLAQPPMRTGAFMDVALARRAARAGVRTVALETVDEQLGFFTGLEPEVHVRLLENALAEIDRGRDTFEKLVDAYLAGDLSALSALAEAQLRPLPPSARTRFRREGLLRRNRRMVERVVPVLERGATLVAVGALHLSGDCGLIALLEARGYAVEPVY